MKKKLSLLLIFLICGIIVTAQDFKFYPDHFTQKVNSSQIAASGAFPYTMPFTENSKWSEMVSAPFIVGTDFKFKNVENIIKVGINHDTAAIIPAYKYQVNLEVAFFDFGAPSTPSITTPITLEISYNPDSLQKYKDLDVHRFTGYHAIQVTIVSVTDITSGTPISLTASSIARNFYVESEVVAQRYDLLPHTIVSGSSVSSSGGELDVFWAAYSSSAPSCPLSAPVLSDGLKPVIYELEWCYIDDYQYNLATDTKSYAFSGSSTINYDFRKNSTRVQITRGTSFSIPLIYEHGAIVFRLRTLRPDQTRYKDIEYGDWTLADNGTVDASSSCFASNGYLITNAHLHDSLNWQYTINFAEEGKYKHVINYFDGSLKDRQTQTKINTDWNYIVAVDKVYDYEGRPSIVSLPTPVYGQNKLSYRPDILTHAVTGNAYRADDFDFLGCTQPDSIPYLSSTALAHKYYSTLNPDQTDMQKFVPDAQGYPMVQTIYSPDNTNKVMWQGGAGLQQQIWRGHSTQYQYTRPTQKEVDRYLGTQVGNYQFYPKQVVTDPNGQSSYSVLDPSGKVVISGLQGPNPDTSTTPIDTLSNFVRGKLECEDLLADYTQEMSANGLSAQLPVFNDELGDASIKYSVQTFPFNTGCVDQFLWAKGFYSMKVTNECGVTMMATTTGEVGESKVTSANGSSYDVMTPIITAMPKGNYLVAQTLNFSETEIRHLVDSFVYANEPSCYNDVHYFIKEAIDSTKFPCEGFIDTTSSYCDRMKMLMMKEMYPGGKYGGYSKNEDSTFKEGKPNSVFYRKAKSSTGDFATKISGFKYIARTGFNPLLGFPESSEVAVYGDEDFWEYSPDGITYEACEVHTLGTYAYGMKASSIARLGGSLRPGGSYVHAPPPHSFWRTYVEIPTTTPLDSVYGIVSVDESVLSCKVNGIEQLPLYLGVEKNGTKAFHYGWNEIIVESQVSPLASPSCPSCTGDELSNITCFFIGYTPWENYPYKDSCIKLPDSVIKDGVVYKNLKDLPVQTLIEIFNDEIAEALLPLHPEYCKLQNCNDANFEQRLEETETYQMAEENNMFLLDSLVAHDPLVYLAGGSVTAHRLKYMKNTMEARIDTMALQRAYCAAGNGEEATYCATKNFKYEIDNFIFVNDKVKQDYFDNLKSLYIGNRTLIKQGKLDSTANTCDTCNLARLTRTGVPVFTSLDKALAAGSSGGDADDSKYPEWMKDLFKKAKDGDSTGMSTTPGPLKDSLNAINLSFAEAEANSLMQHLKNCTLNETTRTTMYNAALNVLKSGRVLSPDIVKSIITDTASLTLSDLCHPFLVAYDIMPDTRPFTVAYACGEDQLYADFRTFMQRSAVVNEIKTATTTVSSGTTFAPVSGNTFESIFSSGPNITIKAYTDGVSPVCATCYVNLIVSSDIKTDTFRITPLHFRTQPNIQDALNSSSPVYSVTGLRCINDAGEALATGYIATNTAVLDLSCSSCLADQSYLIWSAHTPIMSNAPLAASLRNSVTCVDIKKALEDFNSDASVYSYSKATNHPLYQYTVTNYLNFKLKKQYYSSDYQSLMEGCAVTDVVSLNSLLTTYRIEMSSDGNAATLIAALQAYGTHKPDCFQYKTSGGNPVVFVDFNTIAQDTILAYKNFLDAYSTGVVSRNYNYNHADDNTALLFAASACTFNPATHATVYTTQDVSVMENGAYNNDYKLHSFRLNAGSTPKQEANMIAAVEEYLHETTIVSAPICNVGYSFYGRTLLRSSDYHTALKREYLSYIYSLSGSSHDAVIAAIDPTNLAANVSGFSASEFTYDDPYCKGSRTHVYAYDPNPSTLPANAALVRNDILTNVGSQLFPNQNFKYITALGSRLAVIRKANGEYWYRYFDANNRLYNLYIMPPNRQLGTKLEDYTFSISDFQLGPHPNTFIINVHPPEGEKVFCTGYADFEISNLSLVAENVILDKDPTGVYCFDSLDCEKELLSQAILNGKAAYYRYFDSTVKKMSGDMMTHLLTTTVDSLLFCGQKQQYQQTLYYYDLAGNLTQTVPPAGIDPIADVALANVVTVRKSTAPYVALTNHKKQSIYLYNSLNQLRYQHTPDGGSTYFFYDAAGRQIFSQNSKQRPQGLYSYSIYDGQGRPEESGEIAIGCTYETNPEVDFDTTYCTLGATVGPHPDYVTNSYNSLLYPYQSLVDIIRSNVRKEVVRTRYDEETEDLSAITTVKLKKQENLRSRVAAIQYYDELPAEGTTYPSATFATYYSYDFGGNVRNIIYDYPRLVLHQQQHKSIDYDYDLVSGKVNMISYNPGYPDQFYQQYDYDADNRITQVRTSNDGLIWNNDAQYQYYKHGPLARLTIGNQKVQSLEYAYTIQGWLKSINSDVLNPDKDMGTNGLSADFTYPRDIVAHALRYFDQDYAPIGGTAVTYAAATTTKNLYNGNISEQTTGIGALGTMQRTYQYDQLQRLRMAANAVVDDYALTIASPSNLYKTSYAYDPDGNISSLQRWDGTTGTAVQIDNFSYTYEAGNNNNKLLQVRDLAAPTTPPPGGGADLQPGQTTDNYSYDHNGNLTKDKQGDHEIHWDRFGKVKQINSGLTGGSPSHIDFAYDGKGNRIYKDVVTSATPYSIPGGTLAGTTHNAEYYVRDAGGNILASYRVTYKEMSSGEMTSYPMVSDTFSLSEHHIYGSSRLGVQRYDSSTLFNSSGLTESSFDPPPPPPDLPPPPPSPTFGLNQQLSWYSYSYADLIQADKREPYGTDGNTYLGELGASRTLGRRYYEMTDHLGNVLATVLDRKTGAGTLSGSSGTLYDHWSADLASTADYYPGGMMMPGRNTEHDWSRIGMQGQAKDDEVYGKGNVYAYTFRFNDARIIRFFSPDPLHGKYPHNSDYAFAENRLIDGTDLEGAEWRSTTQDNATKITVTIRIINQSKIYNESDVVEFKKMLQPEFSRTYTKESGGKSFYASLLYADKTESANSTINVILRDENTTYDQNGVMTYSGGNAFVSGRNNGVENGTQSNKVVLKVSLNGKKLPINNVVRQAKHELGHTGGLPHPWDDGATPDIAQPEKGYSVTPEKKQLIKSNIMNSDENPRPGLSSSEGNDATFQQVQQINNVVEKEQP
jgi:hypothetical protein